MASRTRIAAIVVTVVAVLLFIAWVVLLFAGIWTSDYYLRRKLLASCFPVSILMSVAIGVAVTLWRCTSRER